MSLGGSDPQANGLAFELASVELHIWTLFRVQGLGFRAIASQLIGRVWVQKGAIGL